VGLLGQKVHRVRRRHRLPIGVLALLLSASACTGPQAPDATAVAVAVDGTVRALAPAATQARASTSSPAASVTAKLIDLTPEAAITATVSVCDPLLTFIADVTIPDGTRLEKGEVFTKTWRIRNDSHCSWGPGFELVFAGGSQMAARERVPIPDTPPGDAADVSARMTAPEADGVYRGEWELCTSDGRCGSPTLFVLVNVVPPATRTPLPRPTPEYSVGSTISRGSFDVKVVDAVRASRLVWSSFGNAGAPQGEFIVVYLDVTNKASSPKALCSFSWFDDEPFVLSSGGRTFIDYNDNFTTEMWRDHVRVYDPDSVVSPGGTIRTALVFDVPPGTTDLWLYMEPLRARVSLFRSPD
jgi:hypothetical protein